MLISMLMCNEILEFNSKKYIYNFSITSVHFKSFLGININPHLLTLAFFR